MINGSFLNFLKSKGLINGKKQIIFESQLLSNKERGILPVKKNHTQRKVKIAGNFYLDEKSSSALPQWLTEDEFDEEEEITGWADWGNSMILQDEGGSEKGSGAGSDYEPLDYDF